MTARVRVYSDPSYLARLAVVFADPIRLKIVWELFLREMSPSQFHAAFGGGTLARVDRHFKRLAEHDWLRLVRTETGGGRRGSTEHFYRAPQLATFDTETWAKLPASLKGEFSWRIFEQFAERVTEAMEADTFDARPERHFSWTPLVLDEKGRSSVIAAVDALFEGLYEEQADARLRLLRSGELPMQATVALAAFDSPDERRNSGLILSSVSPDPRAHRTEVPFHVRVAKVFGNELNLKIVAELNLREMSPSQFSEEIGGALPDVSRRFRLLTDIGWLRKVREEKGGQRRGGVESFYRATGPAIFDTQSWAQVPRSVRGRHSWSIFEQLAERVQAAMDAGTFDARPDRHLTWTPFILDQRGWGQVVTAVDDLFARVLKEQQNAKVRLRRSGERPLIATVFFAAFESPTKVDVTL